MEKISLLLKKVVCWDRGADAMFPGEEAEDEGLNASSSISGIVWKKGLIFDSVTNRGEGAGD